MPRLKTVKSRLNDLPSRIGTVVQPGSDRSRQRDLTNEWRSWYKTARWQRLRLKILKRDAVDLSDRTQFMPTHILFRGSPWLWPTCKQTGALLTAKHPLPNSPVVDHIVPHRGDPLLFWDEDNLQTVSKEYHDKVKQSLERRELL